MHAKSSSGLIRMILIVAVVAVATAVFILRPAGHEEATISRGPSETALPRLIDLGADKCVPCKMMAPILEELKTEQAAYFAVQFIDVWKNPEAAEPYAIRVIPTQIFLAPDGEELFRHEGFFSREEILGKWVELGYSIGHDS